MEHNEQDTSSNTQPLTNENGTHNPTKADKGIDVEEGEVLSSTAKAGGQTETKNNVIRKFFIAC